MIYADLIPLYLWDEFFEDEEDNPSYDDDYYYDNYGDNPFIVDLSIIS